MIKVVCSKHNTESNKLREYKLQKNKSALKSNYSFSDFSEKIITIQSPKIHSTRLTPENKLGAQNKQFKAVYEKLQFST